MAQHRAAFAILLIITASASAQTPAPAGPEELGPIPRGSGPSKAWNARGWAISGEIAEKLSADDSPEVRKAEVERIKMLLRARPAFVTKNNTLPGLLLYKKMYAELIDVADYGIATQPAATDDVALLQKYKVQALAALDRKEESLAAAKGYFNVAPMAKTADSLKLLAETLKTADPDHPERVETFKAEQTAGAEPTAADQLKTPRPRTGVLESIKTDPAPYEKALAARTPPSFFALTGKGNLLLLADRPSEALKVFESAQAFAGEKEAAVASENIARAMRASDGSIGRANAWVESLGK